MELQPNELSDIYDEVERYCTYRPRKATGKIFEIFEWKVICGNQYSENFKKQTYSKVDSCLKGTQNDLKSHFTGQSRSKDI